MHVTIRKLFGILAVIITVAYLTALRLGSMDGPGGIEVSHDAGRAITCAVAVLTILAVAGWISEANIKAAANKEIRGVVAQEVSKALAGHTAEVAATTRAVTIAECRLLLQQDVAEVIEAGLGRAERRGRVAEALSRNEQGRATVHSINGNGGN